MRREEAMTQVRQCVVANGITVCGFVNSTERVHPLPAAISPFKFPRLCQARLGSIFVLGPTVTSQIPYMKIHTGCL